MRSHVTRRLLLWTSIVGSMWGLVASTASANPIPLFPVRTMQVRFDSTLADRFVLDNLAFGDFPFQNLLRFDEVALQSVDGLTVSAPEGGTVTFGFTIGGAPSSEAYYHQPSAANLAYVREPGLGGLTTGVLTMVFAQPASFISFALALSTRSEGIGATVTLLLDDGTDLSTIQRFDNAVEIAPLIDLSEGRFEIPSPFPEPAVTALLAVGAAMMAGWVRTRPRTPAASRARRR